MPLVVRLGIRRLVAFPDRGCSPVGCLIRLCNGRRRRSRERRGAPAEIVADRLRVDLDVRAVLVLRRPVAHAEPARDDDALPLLQGRVDVGGELPERRRPCTSWSRRRPTSALRGRSGAASRRTGSDVTARPVPVTTCLGVVATRPVRLMVSVMMLLASDAGNGKVGCRDRRSCREAAPASDAPCCARSADVRRRPASDVEAGGVCVL